MGNEESVGDAPQAKILEVKTLKRTKCDLVSEYEGIPLVDPLIVRKMLTEKYPDDIGISPGCLPAAQSLIKNYFTSISFHLNKNEEILAQNIKRQLEQYSTLDADLDNRRANLEEKLAEVVKSFKSIDDDVKEATEKLKRTIERADSLAAMIDESLPSFESYKNQ